MANRHKRVYKDTKEGITKPLIRRFANAGGLLENYELSSDVYDAFRNWASGFLEAFLEPLYSKANLKLYLDPSDLNVNIEYKYGSYHEYEIIIQYGIFDRLMRERLQNLVNQEINYKLSKKGLLLMRHYFVENSIDLFSKIKTYMDTTKEKRVTTKHMHTVLNRNQ